MQAYVQLEGQETAYVQWSNNCANDVSEKTFAIICPMQPST